MKKVILGQDLEVSTIGLGCMGMSHAYGAPACEQEMIKLIQQAYHEGVTFFDTAECYVGLDKNNELTYNESILGKALKEVRNKVVIATKFGVKWRDGATGPMILDSRPETIRASVEGSLKRLQTDYIDLYYQHRVDPNVPIEEVANVMKELIQEGKIKHWGLSEAPIDIIKRAHAICPVTAIQSRYSMMFRENEDKLFDTLEKLGIGFVAYSPLANGFLSGKYNHNSKFEEGIDFRSRMNHFKAENMDANQVLLDLLNQLAIKKKATPAQIALAWVVQKRPFIAAIPGTRKPDRLTENTRAGDIELTNEDMAILEEALKHIKIKGV